MHIVRVGRQKGVIFYHYPGFTTKALRFHKQWQRILHQKKGLKSDYYDGKILCQNIVSLSRAHPVLPQIKVAAKIPHWHFNTYRCDAPYAILITCSCTDVEQLRTLFSRRLFPHVLFYSDKVRTAIEPPIINKKWDHLFLFLDCSSRTWGFQRSFDGNGLNQPRWNHASTGDININVCRWYLADDSRFPYG